MIGNQPFTTVTLKKCRRHLVDYTIDGYHLMFKKGTMATSSRLLRDKKKRSEFRIITLSGDFLGIKQ